MAGLQRIVRQPPTCCSCLGDAPSVIAYRTRPPSKALTFGSWAREDKARRDLGCEQKLAILISEAEGNSTHCRSGTSGLQPPGPRLLPRHQHNISRTLAQHASAHGGQPLYAAADPCTTISSKPAMPAADLLSGARSSCNAEVCGGSTSLRVLELAATGFLP